MRRGVFRVDLHYLGNKSSPTEGFDEMTRPLKVKIQQHHRRIPVSSYDYSQELD